MVMKTVRKDNTKKNKAVPAGKVHRWLAEIPDPEIPVINIAELGILRDVTYDQGDYVVTITPTYTACPAVKYISDQIKEKLKEHGIDNVRVTISYYPAWTTDWLNDNTRKKLKDYGIAPPMHSSCNKIFMTADNIPCPFCNSGSTTLISRFSSTPCKAMYQCNSCSEPFEYFKCHL
jgi:ring-1,2-phenylacetyl-CoA epoxidase subunit PaaD